MLKLDNCTAVCIDTENHDLAARAAKICQEACEFKDLFVLSDRQLSVKTKLIRNLNSIKSYSDFVLDELVNYVETDHVLIFQWDGFIINPSSWRAEYLSYDYIGAPWPAGLFARDDVGNGGFSLRSRRLLELTAATPRHDGLFEDVIIANDIARTKKIEIAPLALARQFSFELIPVDIPTFGFHGHFNFIKIMSEKELIAVLHAAPQSFWDAKKPIRWIEDAWKSGRPDLAEYIYTYCLAEFPGFTLGWPSLDFVHSRPIIASAPGAPGAACQDAPPDALPAKVALIVLGMHRSGTSVLTKLITTKGAAAPLALIEPDHQNAEGYWESRRIVETNDALLMNAGSAWDDWQKIEDHALGIVTLNGFIGDAAEIIESEFGAAPLIVIKDPRLSRLYNIWGEAVCKAGYECKPIIIVRAPQEVAMSLHIRDGISIDRGLLIWLRYNLDAERHTRARVRCVVSYDALQTDAGLIAKRIGETLGVVWPDPLEHDAELKPVFSDILRHHRIGSSGIEPSESIAGIAARAYRAMLDLTGDPTSIPAQQALDQIRTEIDGVAALLGPAIQDSEHFIRQELNRQTFITAEYVKHSEIMDCHLDEARAQRDEQAQIVVEMITQAEICQKHVLEARLQRDEQSLRAVAAEEVAVELHRQLIDAKSKHCDDAAQIAALIVHGAGLDKDLAEARAQRDDHVHAANHLRLQSITLQSELAQFQGATRKAPQKRGGSKGGSGKSAP